MSYHVKTFLLHKNFGAFQTCITNGADEPPNMAKAFIQLVKSKAWPCLNLLDAEWLSLSDEQWSCFLEVIPSGKLEKVHAIRSGFGQLAFEQLMDRHKLSVRVLDLDECGGVTSRMLIVILKNCLCLEELGAVMIKVDDIEGQVEGLEIKDSSRWMCNQLKSLRIQFDMMSESTTTSRLASSQSSSTSLTLLPLEYPGFEYSHQIVFRQLVALTQLETLHVRENRGSSNQLQLRYGLDALRQLPELKSLVIGKDMKCFGKENIVQLLVNNPQT
ncbi:hypothetical protein BGZ49_008420 [Haplosporangium sp. Z 27]|nr:hypothetical protein BGZ49_008420 [Haplosporangium sp. Z 27]